MGRVRGFLFDYIWKCVGLFLRMEMVCVKLLEVFFIVRKWLLLWVRWRVVFVLILE